MTYQVRYEREAQKALKKMDKFQAKVILNWIEKKVLLQSFKSTIK